MKVEAKLFLWGAVAFLFIGLIYAWATYMYAPQGLEPVGSVCLLLVGGMTGMISFYLGNTARKLDLRPEDNPRGEIAEAEGDYGFFSPHSWWPLFLGSAAVVLFLGLAVGWWIFVIGVIFGVLSLLGWTYEYFRGDIGI